MCGFVELLRSLLHLYNQRITLFPIRWRSPGCGQSKTGMFQNKSIPRPRVGARRPVLGEHRPRAHNSSPSQSAGFLALGQNRGACCLFFQMFQFLLLSAWAQLNPIDGWWNMCAPKETGASDQPCCLLNYRICSPPALPPNTQFLSIPEDRPSLRVENAFTKRYKCSPEINSNSAAKEAPHSHR